MPLTPRQNTVSSVIEQLRSEKHHHEFLLTHQGLSTGTGRFYDAGELRIVKTYHFEERSNPSHSSILYVIETNDGLKGYSLDAYGGITNDGDHPHERFLKTIPLAEQQS
jgi:hypothetical protein